MTTEGRYLVGRSPVVTMSSRMADATALVTWAQRQGATVRRSRRGWVIAVNGHQVASVHLSPSRTALRSARHDITRGLRARRREQP